MSYDPTPMLTTYERLTNRLVDHVTNALDRYIADRTAGMPSIAKARNAWKPIPGLLDTIEHEHAALGANLAAVWADPDLSPDGRQRRAQALADVAWIAITAAADDVRTRAATILDATRTAAYPVRPTPNDAAQEARLAGLKTDLRMSLDPLDEDRALVRVAQLLTRALAKGDELAAWLLAASDWPADYFTARGFDLHLPALAAAVDQVIATATPDGQAIIRLYRALSDPQTGLPLLDTALGNVLAEVFDDVKAWRPTATNPTPPTRPAAAAPPTAAPTSDAAMRF